MAQSHVQAQSSSTAEGRPSTGQGASRGLRIAGNFTMWVTAFYGLLLVGAIFVSIALTGNAFFPDVSTPDGLGYAGQHTTALALGYLGDALYGTVFFISLA